MPCSSRRWPTPTPRRRSPRARPPRPRRTEARACIKKTALAGRFFYGRVFGGLVLVLPVAIAHAQVLELAGEGIAAPAEQLGGFLLAAPGALQGHLDHRLLEGGQGGVEDLPVAALDLRPGPALEAQLQLVRHRGAGLFPLLHHFRGQVAA